MKRGDSSTDPCASFLQGEVEDYTVMINGGSNDRSRAAAYLTFDAYPLEETVGVEWVSNTATDEDYFEIERSTDNQSFTRIATLLNTRQSKDNYYQFIDEAPTFGDNYYRVKQVLLDGSVAYTHTKMIRFGEVKTHFTAFPNPATTHLTITLEEADPPKGTIIIVNLLGQVMDTRAIEDASTVSTIISLDNYKNGLYTIYIKLKNQPSRSKVFIVDKG